MNIFRIPPRRAATWLGLGVVLTMAGESVAETPLPPGEARKKLGEQVLVHMEVKAAKDRLEKRGEIYLDSETDFRDEKNLAVVITRRGAERLRLQGIADPAEHYRGETIRARGTVKEVDEVRRIEIDSADQIELVPQS